MDSAIVKNAVGSLEKILRTAKDALADIETDVFGGNPRGETGSFENPGAALTYFLQQLHDILLVHLEAAGMHETRASLVKAWQEFSKSPGGIGRIIDDPEFYNCESPALTFLERLLQGLRISVTEAMSGEEGWTLTRLEAMLRDTAGLVHRRNIAPANEIELQGIMHDYLGACFPDFIKNPSIPGTLKHFKPDCGIRSVGAAVEFKMVHEKNQVAVAFSGIAEDSAGYRASKDWTNFYAVIYQAEPFILESHLRSDLKRIGATTWQAIVVNGPTKAKEAVRKKSPAK